MKLKSIVVLFIIASNLMITSCTYFSKKPTKTIIINEKDIVHSKINIKGMTCVGCEVTLENNLTKIDGVIDIKASHTNNEAIITYDSTKTNLKIITKTITNIGYKTFPK